MLDHLIESRNHNQERTILGGYMATTAIIVLALLTVGLIYSLFSQNLVLGANNLEISALVAPVPLEIKPQPVDEPKPQTTEKTAATESKVPIRRENIQAIEETPRSVPKTIAVTPSANQSRPNSRFKIGNVDFNSPVVGGEQTKRPSGNNPSGGLEYTPELISEEREKTPELPPVIKHTPKVAPVTVSGGVVNGKAVNLVKPVYSAAVRNLGIKGEVKIQVTIDENGNVISASAVSGHPLLRSSAVSAARSSKFTPTTLSQQRVMVTGVIVYNFS
jgi:periplasmic protein TonB